MAKLYVIGLDATEGHFEDFQNFIESYQNWCFENESSFFGQLDDDYDLDFISLANFHDSDIFDSFQDIEGLKDVAWSEKKAVVYVVYDVDGFENYDAIQNYLKSNFNYLEYPLSSFSGSEEVFKFEQFVKTNCTV
ncbi:MAG: hypothetical protein RLZZ29_839 [Cyanobacteriota bacterium]|jgi:hypothetical protein